MKNTKVTAGLIALATTGLMLSACSSDPNPEPTETPSVVVEDNTTQEPANVIEEPTEPISVDELADQEPGVYDVEEAPSVDSELEFSDGSGSEEIPVGGVVPGTSEGKEPTDPNETKTPVTVDQDGNTVNWDEVVDELAWSESRQEYVYPWAEPDLEYGRDADGRLVVIE